MAYFDAELNAERMPVADRMDKEYKVFVDNLPPELNEVSIREIFRPYGQITGMFYRRNATWAFISYATFREAELAIRELNNKKPLELKVALAKERCNVREEPQQSCMSGSSEEKSIKVDNVAESLFANRDVKQQQGIGRGQVLSKYFTTPKMTSHKCAEAGSSHSFSSSRVSISENEESFVNTNRLWTRGVVTVTADGKRHVSLGRGYTLYEFPDPTSKIEDYILKVHEIRNNGLYESAEAKLKNTIQRCLVCSNKTTKHCEKCHTYYCSKICQIADWPRHQAECERIPELVEETNRNISLLEIKDEKIPKPNVTDKVLSDIKLRRPNTPMQKETLSSVTTRSDLKSSVDIKPCNSNDKYSNDQNRRSFVRDNSINLPSSFNQSNHSRNYQGGTVNKTDPTSDISDNAKVNIRSDYNGNKNQPQRNAFQTDKRSISYNDREPVDKRESRASITNVTNEDLTFYKDTYLSKTKFTTVEVVMRENGEYWIYKVEDEEARNSLMADLQSIAEKSSNVHPVVGDVYGVLYENDWHRAMAISLNPVKVHFIDFGNDEVLQKNASIKDIGDMIKIPRFARKIRLTQGMNEKYKFLSPGQKLSVRMLSMDAEKVIVVEVQEQSESLTLRTTENATSSINNVMVKHVLQKNSKIPLNIDEKAAVVQLPSIIDALAEKLSESKGSELKIGGLIQIYGPLQKNVYSAALLPEFFATEFEKILDQLPKECAKMKEPANYKPCVGDLICGEVNNTEEWYRGYLVSTLPELRLAAVDEARILPVSKVLPYPEKFRNVCTFGVTCEVINGESVVKDSYHIIAVNHNLKQNSFMIEMIKDDDAALTSRNKTVKAIIKHWKHETKSSVPEFAELKNGSKVCLTNYRSQHVMSARSLDEGDVDYYNSIMQRVAQCALTASPVLFVHVGQTVIAPFDDGNNYRAMVTQVLNDNVTIMYTDFGNFKDIKAKELRILPDDLKMKRSCMANIVLKDVPHDIPMNAEVDSYLRNLTGKEVPMTCDFEMDPIKNGVILTTSTGECINDTIKQLLIPSWKRETYDDKTCYMVSDLSVASLGRVGDPVDAFLLYTQDDKFMMGPYDVDLITHIIEVMPIMMKEYCEKAEYYIPRANELCLALYEEAWYRALCINPKLSHTTCEIYFVDYGNTEPVQHRNVRLMPKDFVIPNAMANICKLVNLAPTNSADNFALTVKQISELIPLYTVVKIKIVEHVGSNEYKVELSDIKTLIQQSLMSSS